MVDNHPPPYFGMSKRLYLQTLANKYGDFRVAHCWQDRDGLHWSRHRSVLECWESQEGLKYLDKANNRTQLPCEITLDVDAPTLEQARTKAREICDKLDDAAIKYSAWFSGSKGYHIHIIFPELIIFEQIKKTARARIIALVGADAAKISDGSMITLEWTQNNKTGIRKKFVRGDPNWLTL